MRGPLRPDYAERYLVPFTQNIRFDHDCWVWTGKLGSGYGRAEWGGVRWAHRVAWTIFKGPLPATDTRRHTLDHLCRNTACVNPDHLELIDHRQNVLRGEPANRATCPKGHEYNNANTYRRPTGKRQCRACGRARYHASKESS